MRHLLGLTWILLVLLASFHAEAQSYFKGVGLIETPTSQATAGGTTTLTLGSNTVQRFTGASNQTVVLPDATTLTAGRYFLIANDSSGIITVQNATPSTLKTIKAGDSYSFRLASAATAAGTWTIETNFNSVSLTADVTGTLPIANGGTNATSFSNRSILFYDSAATAISQDNTHLQWNTAAGILEATNVRVASSVVFMDPALNQITMSTPALLTSPWNFILPQNAGSASQFMQTDGAGNTSWATVTASDVSGIIPLSKGGTNANNTANAGGVAFSTASAISLGPVGTSGQPLVSGGAGSPTWFNSGIAGPVITSSGGVITSEAQLALARGGTNASITASNGGVAFSTAAAISIGPVGASGQVLTSSGAGAPTWTSNTFPSTATAPCSLVANTNNTVTCLAATTTNRILRTNGTTLSFSQLELASDVSGILPLANGGTSANITASHGGLVYSTASAMSVGPVGTSGYIATSSGAGAPAWIEKVPEANGGTNQTTYATGDMLYASSANTLSKLAAGTADFILNMSSGVPTWRSSVTSNSASNVRVEGARISGGSATTACTGSPCTIVSSTSWLSSVTRGGSGQYTLNFSPNWGTAPYCTFTGGSGDSTVFRAESSSTSAYSISVRNPTSLSDTAFDVICVGIK